MHRRRSKYGPGVPGALCLLLVSCGDNGPGTITPPPDVTVASIVVTPTQSSVDQGAQVQHTASAFSTDGTPVPNPTFQWSSSDSDVVTISPTGLATARLWGQASVQARIGNVTGTSVFGVNAPPIPLVPTFPSAEGYGAETLRLCRQRPLAVHRVTNTQSDGEGSLLRVAEELSHDTFDVIVFEVGGTITLYQTLEIRASCVYIAGQTAPGGGIQIRSPSPTHTNTPLAFPDDRSTHDIVLRFVRIRSGRGEAAKPDNIRASSGWNIMFDHISTAFGNDESIDLSSAAASAGGTAGGLVTVQWSVIAATLVPHSTGMLISGNVAEGPYPSDISIHKNAFANNANRNPLVRRTRCVEVVNNVIYNWRGRIGNIEGNACVDIVGNYMRAGPWTRLGDYWQVVIDNAEGITEDPTVHVDDNIGDPFHLDPQFPQELLVRYGRDRTGALPDSAYIAMPQASPLYPIQTRGPLDALVDVLADVGASRRLTCEGTWTPIRDALDALIVQQIQTDAGPATDEESDHESDYGGIPVLDEGVRCVDTDQDGMPDAYELRVGFDPNDPTDAAEDRDRDGYLNIEEYLNVTDPKA